MKDFKNSSLISKYMVMPHHANPNGFMFGGILIGWMDMAAAMLAEEYSGRNVVTVAMEKIVFTSPILVGEQVKIEANIIGTGRSSMNIKVSVHSKNAKSGIEKRTTEALLTFVAIDQDMKPTAISDF